MIRKLARTLELSKHCTTTTLTPCFRQRRFFVQPAQQTLHSFSSSPTEFDSYTYAALLQRCVQTSNHHGGRCLHCHILKRGNCLDSFALDVLLNFYVRLGEDENLFDATKLFDEMPGRSTVSFVTLIQGFVQFSRFHQAFDLFFRLYEEGHELSAFAFSTVLKLVASLELAELGFCVHASVCKLGFEGNAFVGTALLDAYSVCGHVDCARKVFDAIAYKDVVSWSRMVACYADNDSFDSSLRLFSQMRMFGFEPNYYNFVSVIKACVGLEASGVGKGVHACALKMGYEVDLYVGVGLLEFYSMCECVDDAMRVFEGMPKNNVITWSFMIGRYAQNNQSIEAVKLFYQMRQNLVLPNQFTFSSVLHACANLVDIQLGLQVHCHIIKVGLEYDTFVSNAMMDVYAKCGRIENAMELFADLQNKNEVTWNTVIVGYAQSANGEKALSLFKDMLECQVQPTEVTYSSALRACAILAALEPGMQVHSLSVKTLFDKSAVVSNGLIDMYAKCGSIKDARTVFNMLNECDEVSWNAMISGYSLHGLGEEALKLFEMMQETGCKPNHVTFVSVLSACGNAGLLDRGHAYFRSMVHDYNIQPCAEHYTCMAWLFGRAGHLDKVIKLIEEMPFEPSLMTWRALLGACVIHNNPELGRTAALQILEIDPLDEAAHVLLSNIYATARRWENVASVRKSMKQKGVKKEPGLSWVENLGTVHYFTVGDMSHPDMKMIRGMLEWLKLKARKAGYVADHNAVLNNIEDIDKERRLWVHSERLALAYALVRTPTSGPIRIIKNLRICADCHAAIKVISQIVQRDVIVRDMNRFHHFQNGICSCSDYW